MKINNVSEHLFTELRRAALSGKIHDYGGEMIPPLSEYGRDLLSRCWDAVPNDVYTNGEIKYPTQAEPNVKGCWHDIINLINNIVIGAVFLGSIYLMASCSNGSFIR